MYIFIRLQEWGVSLDDMLEPSAATSAYTDFLRNAAETQVMHCARPT
jgi:thiaminase